MGRIALHHYLQYIEALIEQSNYSEAASHSRFILQQFPRHVDSYRLLGRCLLETQQHNDAIDIFQRVLSAEPDDFVARAGLAVALKETGETKKAIWHMERAFELDPYNKPIQDALRSMYADSGIDFHHRLELTRAALARLYFRGALYDQAAAEARAVLKEQRERLDLLTLLAESLHFDGRQVEAAEVSHTIIEVLPYSVKANAILAHTADASHRYDEAHSYRQLLQSLLVPDSTNIEPDSVVDHAFTSNGTSMLPETVLIDQLDYMPLGGTRELSPQTELPSEPAASADELPVWLKEFHGDDQLPEPGIGHDTRDEDGLEWLRGVAEQESDLLSRLQEHVADVSEQEMQPPEHVGHERTGESFVDVAPDVYVTENDFSHDRVDEETPAITEAPTTLEDLETDTSKVRDQQIEADELPPYAGSPLDDDFSWADGTARGEEADEDTPQWLHEAFGYRKPEKSGESETDEALLSVLPDELKVDDDESSSLPDWLLETLAIGERTEDRTSGVPTYVEEESMQPGDESDREATDLDRHEEAAAESVDELADSGESPEMRHGEDQQAADDQIREGDRWAGQADETHISTPEDSDTTLVLTPEDQSLLAEGSREMFADQEIGEEERLGWLERIVGGEPSEESVDSPITVPDSHQTDDASTEIQDEEEINWLEEMAESQSFSETETPPEVSLDAVEQDLVEESPVFSAQEPEDIMGDADVTDAREELIDEDGALAWLDRLAAAEAPEGETDILGSTAGEVIEFETAMDVEDVDSLYESATGEELQMLEESELEEADELADIRAMLEESELLGDELFSLASEMPEDPDEAMAWLEQLASEQGATAEEMMSFEPEGSEELDEDSELARAIDNLSDVELPENEVEAQRWLEELTGEHAGEFTFEQEVAQVLDEDLEEMSWLEHLAAEQDQALQDMEIDTASPKGALPQWMDEEAQIVPHEVEEQSLDWIDNLDDWDAEEWLQAEEEAAAEAESKARERQSFEEMSREQSADEVLESVLEEADIAYVKEDLAAIELSLADMQPLTAAREALSEGLLDDAIEIYRSSYQDTAILPHIIDDLESAVAQNEDHTELKRMLGDAYAKNGQLTKAIEMYRQALDYI